MSHYQVPLKEMSFLLYEVFKADKFWQSTQVLAEQIDKETAEAILQECAKVAEEQIAPLFRQGDEQGVSFNDGKVTTADGYKEAYQTYANGGWTALGGDTEYGGMGMPKVLTAFNEEMLCSADIAFSLYVGLTAGAGLAIEKHGDGFLKARFLTRTYAGDWMASMCLTEAHAGSDLGLIHTKAQKHRDNSYVITGSKMFITGGEHDLTENIVHLVLAKLPNAPKGPKGISLFLVPKYQVNDDGSLGDFNKVSCGSIEEKMGIHGSSTCVMNFEGSLGYLVGEENQGLACMFTMMNFERIGVGLQGIGAAERSYQNALSYAKDRRQGRSLNGAIDNTEVADSIMVHGDVRRMLLNMKALTEGSRALSTYISLQLDIATYGEGDAKERAEALVSLMTPLAKAFFTDLGFESTVSGQQVFGGHGYIREWGQEQLVRDTRISQIYEGTNGIQAMDLLARKVAGSKGQLMALFIDEVSQYIVMTDAENMREFVNPLEKACKILADITQQTLNNAALDKNHLGSAANDYLHLFGYTAMAYAWARMAEAALSKQASDNFYHSKVKTARYYFIKLLPRIESLKLLIQAGCDCLFDIDDSLF